MTHFLSRWELQEYIDHVTSPQALQSISFSISPQDLLFSWQRLWPAWIHGSAQLPSAEGLDDQRFQG